MTRIYHNIRINAPKEKVWSILADLGAIQNFNPGVKKSYYVSEEKQGPGASRVCELIPLGSIKETATAWQEGESFALDIRPLSPIPPLKQAVGRFTLKADGQHTIITLAMEYNLKFGPLGVLLNALAFKSQFRRGLSDLLLGLKHHAETGELVDQKVIKRLKTTLGSVTSPQHGNAQA